MTIEINNIEKVMIVASLELAEKITREAAQESLYNDKINSYYELVDYAHNLYILKNNFIKGENLKN